jgi:hypothetical protein
MKDGWISRQLAQARFYLGSEAHYAELSTMLSTFVWEVSRERNIADAGIVGCLLLGAGTFQNGSAVTTACGGSRDRSTSRDAPINYVS